MTKTIAVLALPGVQMLDVSGPLDVFAQANAELGRPYYALRVVAYEPGPVRSSSGVRLLPDAVVGDALPRLNTLLVAGTPHARAPCSASRRCDGSAPPPGMPNATGRSAPAPSCWPPPACWTGGG